MAKRCDEEEQRKAGDDTSTKSRIGRWRSQANKALDKGGNLVEMSEGRLEQRKRDKRVLAVRSTVCMIYNVMFVLSVVATLLHLNISVAYGISPMLIVITFCALLNMILLPLILGILHSEVLQLILYAVMQMLIGAVMTILGCETLVAGLVLGERKQNFEAPCIGESCTMVQMSNSNFMGALLLMIGLVPVISGIITAVYVYGIAQYLPAVQVYPTDNQIPSVNDARPVENTEGTHVVDRPAYNEHTIMVHSLPPSTAKSVISVDETTTAPSTAVRCSTSAGSSTSPDVLTALSPAIAFEDYTATPPSDDTASCE